MRPINCLLIRMLVRFSNISTHPKYSNHKTTIIFPDRFDVLLSRPGDSRNENTPGPTNLHRSVHIRPDLARWREKSLAEVHPASRLLSLRGEICCQWWWVHHWELWSWWRWWVTIRYIYVHMVDSCQSCLLGQPCWLKICFIIPKNLWFPNITR